MSINGAVHIPNGTALAEFARPSEAEFAARRSHSSIRAKAKSNTAEPFRASQPTRMRPAPRIDPGRIQASSDAELRSLRVSAGAADRKLIEDELGFRDFEARHFTAPAPSRRARIQSFS